jgi:hypothetical protein
MAEHYSITFTITKTELSAAAEKQLQKNIDLGIHSKELSNSTFVRYFFVAEQWPALLPTPDDELIYGCSAQLTEILQQRSAVLNYLLQHGAKIQSFQTQPTIFSQGDSPIETLDGAYCIYPSEDAVTVEEVLFTL